MIDENSGKIYGFPLLSDLGYAFGEILDFSDVSGIFIKVNNYFSSKNDKPNINKIINSPKLFGPERIHRLPNTRGKGSWKYIGKNENYEKNFPSFKFSKDNSDVLNWAKLKKYRKVTGYGLNETSYELPYEEIRHLPEKMIRHKNIIPMKISIMRLLQLGRNVYQYYNFLDIDNRTIYLEIINTYYPKEKADELIKELEDFHYSKMKELLNEGKNVFDYFEVWDIVNASIFKKTVHELYSKEKAEDLIREMEMAKTEK
jgi:hypothetical protein